MMRWTKRRMTTSTIRTGAGRSASVVMPVWGCPSAACDTAVRVAWNIVHGASSHPGSSNPAKVSGYHRCSIRSSASRHARLPRSRVRPLAEDDHTRHAEVPSSVVVPARAPAPAGAPASGDRTDRERRDRQGSSRLEEVEAVGGVERRCGRCRDDPAPPSSRRDRPRSCRSTSAAADRGPTRSAPPSRCWPHDADCSSSRCPATPTPMSIPAACGWIRRRPTGNSEPTRCPDPFRDGRGDEHVHTESTVDPAYRHLGRDDGNSGGGEDARAPSRSRRLRGHVVGNRRSAHTRRRGRRPRVRRRSDRTDSWPTVRPSATGIRRRRPHVTPISSAPGRTCTAGEPRGRGRSALPRADSRQPARHTGTAPTNRRGIGGPGARPPPTPRSPCERRRRRIP